jgi:hypothetical protein
MVTAVKRIYENSISEDHPGTAISRRSHRGYPISEDHLETAVSRRSHRGYSISEDHLETVILKLSHRGYSIIEKHPKAEIDRLSLEGNLCVFCRTLDETRMEDCFAEFVAEWRRGTGGLSSPRAITSHPAYQQIIKMGETALPMIFQELQENGGWWYPALRALTGENPVPEEAKGRPPLNREAWLEWGRRNGYLQP